MLTVKEIKALKPAKGKSQTKYTDSKGLVLLVHENGGKYWQYNYRFLGDQKTLSLGTFDDVSLKDARDLRDDARSDIRNNIDPTEKKKQNKLRSNSVKAHTFEVLAEQWLNQKKDRGEKNKKDIRGRFKNHINPSIGSKQISDVTLEDLRKIFASLDEKGIHTRTIRKIWQNVFNIYKYAIPLEACKHNLAADVEGVLKSGDEVIPRKALALKDLPLFLNKIDSYNGKYETIQALKALTLSALRPNEIQKAKWSEFNLEKRQWTIVKKR